MRKALLLIICLISAISVKSQCTHIFRIVDSYGDGWNGASVDLLVNGVVALNEVEATDNGNNPSSEDVSFTASSGDIISLSNWISGSWNGEISWEIIDGNGAQLASGVYGDTPTVIGNCPSSCNEVININTSNLTTSSVDIEWATNVSANSWTVEYGLSGYSQGAGNSTNVGSNSTSISGLNSNTTYDVYFQTICAGETSNWSGPFSFTTVQEGACGGYTINLFDSWGDGWNGASIEVIINGSTANTLTIDDGDEATFNISVFNGDIIEFYFNSGSYDSEITFSITNPDGNNITDIGGTTIEDYPAPSEGYFTSQLEACPCPSDEYAIASFSQECADDLSYSITVSVTELGNSSTSLDILVDGIVEITGVGIGSHIVTGIYGSSILQLVNDNGCTTAESFINICDPCTSPNAPSDEPCDAPAIDLSQPFFGSTDCGYTETPESDQPDVFCGTIENDSWLTFIAADDTVILDWEVEDAGSGTAWECDVGVQLSIFEGYCTNQEGMELIACENPALYLGSFTIPELTIGEEYFIRIDGYAGQLCDYSWTPQVGVAITPPNDTCFDAIVLSCGDVDTSNNILAEDNDAPTCSGQSTNDGVWYKFIGEGSTVTISTDNVATNYDTRLFLFSGDCDNLVCIDSDDNSGSGETSEIVFIAENGTDYYVYVTGDGSAEGQFGFSLNCVGCEAEPGNWDD